ncbi:unnamed protein product [Brassica rapa]|uniref:Uncharacterized protein n=1 Tax=Brassica campestris TaxID=3711 RepID=A0A3P6AWP5_BRACM|nr:unnamed protein product [Brassica rapa]VDC95507.1 unnamed protein product [Brassica rapa]
MPVGKLAFPGSSLIIQAWRLLDLHQPKTMSPPLAWRSTRNPSCSDSRGFPQLLTLLSQNRFTSACSSNQQENFDDGTLLITVRHRLCYLLF